MKAIYKSLAAALIATPLLTGCIEEAEPTTIITADQLQSSPKAVEALVYALSGHLNNVGTLSTSYHFDWGYPSMLHIRDVMTEDMYVRDAGGYNWFSSWSSNDVALGADYLICQYSWNYYYEQILTCNNVMGNIDREEAKANQQLAFYLAAGLTARAYVYLDVARLYEFLPTEFNTGVSAEGNSILGLTAPWVDENTTEDMAHNNPRLTHDEMFGKILTDLTDAIEYFNLGIKSADKTLASPAVAYGLLARLYLWDASYKAEVDLDADGATEAYNKAAEYARLAITTSGATPLTQEEWLDKTRGFNDSSFSSWMYAGQYVQEDAAVQTSLLNWTSFMCNEQNFGYAGSAAGAYTEIGASLYNRMNDRDFRKLSYKAPDDSPLADRVPYIDAEHAATYFDSPYIAIKFRPGSGNMDEFLIACSVAYPLMRVEEMYLIEAEAVAHVNPAQGRQLLVDFMRTYRYSTYSTKVTSEEDVVEEIIFQKRVELWGEGQSFFDIKRLNYSVERWYNGTNFEPGLDTFNTNGRPAWMNFVINMQEVTNNSALVGFNSPSPAGLYDPIRQ